MPLTLQDELNSRLPEGWYISNIINLNHVEWQINASNEEYVASATGEEIETALAALHDKILEGKYTGRLFSVARMAHVEQKLTLAQALGIVRPVVKIERRL